MHIGLLVRKVPSEPQSAGVGIQSEGEDACLYLVTRQSCPLHVAWKKQIRGWFTEQQRKTEIARRSDFYYSALVMPGASIEAIQVLRSEYSSGSTSDRRSQSHT